MIFSARGFRGTGRLTLTAVTKAPSYPGAGWRVIHWMRFANIRYQKSNRSRAIARRSAPPQGSWGPPVGANRAKEFHDLERVVQYPVPRDGTACCHSSEMGCPAGDMDFTEIESDQSLVHCR